MSLGLAFNLLATDGAARRGRLSTAHGEVETPAFMPVGTVGTVKGMHPQSVKETGAHILLGNTYHLMLRPGAERVAQLGGLHKFMNWSGPILTDSGGFQVMSLAGLRKLDESGVTFRSHIDGSKHHLTPERSMQIQHLLDSNITMAFDECTPYPATHEQAAASMRLSMRWARRSKDAFVARAGYGLFGIVQGSTFEDLRAESAAALRDVGFDGYAIRRSGGGRRAGGNVPHPRLHHADAAHGAAALFDGGRAARRHHRRGAARRRHVRLRHADPVGADGASLRAARRGQHQKRPPRP